MPKISEKRKRRLENSRRSLKLALLSLKIKRESRLLNLTGPVVTLDNQAQKPATTKTASQLYLESRKANNQHNNSAISVSNNRPELDKPALMVEQSITGTSKEKTQLPHYEDDEADVVKVEVKEENSFDDVSVGGDHNNDQEATCSSSEDETYITLGANPKSSRNNLNMGDPLRCSVIEMDCNNTTDHYNTSNKTSSLYPKNKSSSDPNGKFKCILCYETIDVGMKLDSASPLNEDLLVMFVLEKMLQVPNEKLTMYLKYFGQPREWISCCNRCMPLIKNAFDVQKSINALEKNLLEFKNKIQRKIKRSWSVYENFPKVSGWSYKCKRITNEARNYVAAIGGRKKQPKNETGGNVNVMKKKAKTLLSSSVPENTYIASSAEQLTVAPPMMMYNEETDSEGDYDTCTSDNIGNFCSVQPTELSSTKVPSPEWVKQHSILSDTGYSCVLCPKLKTMGLHSYVRHVLYHHKRPYQCSKCKVFYSGNQAELINSPMNALPGRDHTCSLETLVKKEFEPGNIWGCGHCAELFKFESERNSHEEAVHYQNPPISLYHTCSICSQMFRNLSELRLHRAVTHPAETFFSCFHCNESFKDTTKDGAEMVDFCRMREHMKLNHKNTRCEILDECNLCGENFSSKAFFEAHFEQEHGVDKKEAYPCPICYKRIKDKSYLKVHVDIHFDRHRNRFHQICDVCGRVAWTNTTFLDHKLVKHGIEPPTETQVFSCSQENCAFKSVAKSTFQTHMMKFHGAPRKFKCQHCGKGFLNSKHYREHLEIHKNATTKPFQCEICGNSFAVKNYLYIHMRLSHQNRPFASTHKKKPARNRKKPRSDCVTQNNQATMEITQSVECDS